MSIAHGDRLVGLVGDDDALAHLAAGRGVLGGRRGLGAAAPRRGAPWPSRALRRWRGGARRLAPALGLALGVALLGRARRAASPACARARRRAAPWASSGLRRLGGAPPRPEPPRRRAPRPRASSAAGASSAAASGVLGGRLLGGALAASGASASALRSPASSCLFSSAISVSALVRRRCRARARRSGRGRGRAWRRAGPRCSPARRWRAGSAGRTALARGRDVLHAARRRCMSRTSLAAWHRATGPPASRTWS